MTTAVRIAAFSVLQIIEPSGGGSGRHVIDLCRGLKMRGHRVVAVYSPVRAERRFVDELLALDLDGVHAVHMTRSPGPSDLKAWLDLQKIIRNNGPFDIVHAHSSKAGALSRIRLPGPHVPRVYTPHAFRTMDPTLGGKGRLVFGTIEGILGRWFSDAVICVSPDEHAHAKTTLHIPERRLATIVNGVATPPGGTRHAVRERFGIPDHALIAGFVGRLSAQKAPERLLNAFEIIAADLPDLHLLMVGNGELEATVKNMISQSRHTERIHLTSDIPGADAVDAFDVMVQPSRYEAMSYVMLEAAAAGKPMVLTETGGAKVVLEDGVNGILVPNGDDPLKLAAAMKECLQGEHLPVFTQAARARAGRFGLAAMIGQTENLYARVIGASREAYAPLLAEAEPLPSDSAKISI